MNLNKLPAATLFNRTSQMYTKLELILIVYGEQTFP